MKKLSLISLVIALILACTNRSKELNDQYGIKKTDRPQSIRIDEKVNSIFAPLEETTSNPDNAITEDKVNLGKMLFHDTRLSMKGNNSCNSCHNLATFGVDNLPTSKGVNGGVSVSDFLLQNLADILQVSVQRSMSKECTELGVALMAAKAIGFDSNFLSISSSHTFTPQISLEERNKRYRKWLLAIEKSKDWAREEG